MGNRFTPRRPPHVVIGPSIAYLELTRGQYAMIDAEEWAARTHIGGKYAHLGTYDTPQEASRVYMLKVKEIYGEFARTI
jgi:hypothetical protein